MAAKICLGAKERSPEEGRGDHNPERRTVPHLLWSTKFAQRPLSEKVLNVAEPTKW